MKAARRYVIGDTPTPTGKITVTANFSSSPSGVTVNFTDYLFDKTVGLMLTQDDGSSWGIDIAEMIKDYHYSDNAGNLRQVGYGFAITGNVRDGSNPTYMSWEQLSVLLADDNNLTLLNHSYSHGDSPSPLEQLVMNEDAVRNNLDVEMNVIVPPSGLPGFVQAGFDSGNYRMVSSQGYYNPDGPDADGYNDEVSYVDGSQFSDIITNRMMITTRWNMDGSLVPGVADLKDWLDGRISEALTNNEKRICAAFSHGPYTTEELDALEEFIQYALTLNGGDMWMPNHQQYCDYQDVRQRGIISTPIVSGNSMTFEIDLDNLHARTKYTDMSLKFSGGTLLSVSVENAESFSVNTTTRLLNILNNEPFVPPIENIDDIINPLVDHRYIASNSRNSSNLPPTNGQDVETILDSVGDKDLTVSVTGINVFGQPPELYKQFGVLSDLNGEERSLDMVFMDNQAGIQFRPDDRENQPFPRAKGRVWFQPNYFLFEAYDNETFSPYFGELNSGAIVGNATIRFTTGESWNDYSVPLVTNGINYLYQEFIEDGQETDPGRVSIKIWFNGEPIDHENHHETYRRTSVNEGFGTAESNCAMHGFIENFDIYGRVLTEEQRELVWESIKGYYKVTEPLSLPYASNVNFNNSSGVVTATYTFNSFDGNSEDTSEREIYWVSYAPGGGIQSGEVVPELNNVITFNRADFSDKFNGGCRVNIRVVDSVTGYKSYIPGVRYKGSL